MNLSISKYHSTARRRRGTTTVMVILAAVSILLLGFLANNVIMIGDTEEELQNATDTAALSAAYALLHSDQMSPIVAAREAAASLKLFNHKQVIENSDLALGRADLQASGKYTFVKDSVPFNAVRIQGHRNAQHSSGGIPMLTGQFGGISQISLNVMATAKFAEQDIAIVVDCSGFMHGPDRFEEASRAFEQIMASVREMNMRARVSLTTFSKEGDTIAPLTSDLDAVEDCFSQIVLRGPRDVGAGITEGLRSLYAPSLRSDSDKLLILLSECKDTSGLNINVVGNRLKLLRVNFLVYTFGKNADRALAANLAAAAGGKHVHDPSNSQLSTDISTELRSASVYLVQ